MLSFRTTGHSGFAAKYSSFYDNKIAVATSTNYGLAGNGRLYVLTIQPTGQITQDKIYDTQDGLFDLAWSELNENQVVTASGDGSIKLFDCKVDQFPVAAWNEHHKEVFSVNWNLIDKQNFISSSWDGNIKLWLPHLKRSILTLLSNANTFLEGHNYIDTKPSTVPLTTSNKPGANLTHKQCVYQAKFSPHNPTLIASVNASSRLQLWDVRAPRPLQMDILAHNGLECLSLDFNKYRSTVLATAGVDKSIRIWDMRMITNPFPQSVNNGPTPQYEIMGHHFAVRNVVWSPHSSGELLSSSYDMSAKVWEDPTDSKSRSGRRLNNASGCLKSFNMHKEFVIGGDWSLWGEPGWVVTTGWDEMVYVWNTKR